MFYYDTILTTEYVNKILYRPVIVRVVVVQTKAKARRTQTNFSNERSKKGHVSCETFHRQQAGRNREKNTTYDTP